MKTSTDLIVEFEKEQGIDLIRDGIINNTTFTTSKYKILFIMKEVNMGGSKFEKGFSLNDVIAKWIEPKKVKKDWRGTYNKLILGANAIVTGEANYKIKESISSLNHCAVINVNKSGGGARTNLKKLAIQFEQQKEILKAQLEEINPNIIVCSGTYKVVKPLLLELYHHLSFEKQKLKDFKYKKCYFGDKLIIDYYHPAYAMNQKKYIENLLSAYQNWIEFKQNQ